MPNPKIHEPNEFNKALQSQNSHEAIKRIGSLQRTFGDQLNLNERSSCVVINSILHVQRTV